MCVWVCVCPVYTVVTYLKNDMNRGDFFMTLRNQPVALSLYRQVSSPGPPDLHFTMEILEVKGHDREA